jgi:hypothetical protein
LTGHVERLQVFESSKAEKAAQLRLPEIICPRGAHAGVFPALRRVSKQGRLFVLALALSVMKSLRISKQAARVRFETLLALRRRSA